LTATESFRVGLLVFELLVTMLLVIETHLQYVGCPLSLRRLPLYAFGLLVLSHACFVFPVMLMPPAGVEARGQAASSAHGGYTSPPHPAPPPPGHTHTIAASLPLLCVLFVPFTHRS
jgi:hypothetical protein